MSRVLVMVISDKYVRSYNISNHLRKCIRTFLRLYVRTHTFLHTRRKSHHTRARQVINHSWSEKDQEYYHSQYHQRRPKIGHTPLIEAVRSRNCEIVRILLQNGAHLDGQDCNGQSLLQVSKLEDPEIRRPQIEQITSMIEAARYDRQVLKSPSRLSSALLFASRYRSSRTPKLPRDVVGLTQTTRAATVQSVYMSRLAQGQSAHIQQVEEEKVEHDAVVREEKKQCMENKSNLEIEIEEHSRFAAEIDEKSKYAERAIRLVSKRTKDLDDAYDTIEKLQNMLTEGKILKTPVNCDNENVNFEEEKRRRNVVVLRCLSRIRRNKIFAFAFRKWSMVVSSTMAKDEQEMDESLKWKQKYEETNEKLDTLQRKFDEVMPILIAAAERAAGRGGGNGNSQRKEEGQHDKEKESILEDEKGNVDTVKALSTVVNSKTCVVM